MDATATDRDLDVALAATGEDAAGRLAAREELNRLGYIWCPPGQLPPVLWGAGIPSLMQYVQDQAAAKPGKRDTSSLLMSKPAGSAGCRRPPRR